MKGFLILLLVTSLFSFTRLAAEETQYSREQIEQVREILFKGYKRISSLKDDEWEDKFNKTAEKLYEIGEVEKAQAMQSMADRNIKEYVLELYKEKLDIFSENGVGLIFGVGILMVDLTNPGHIDPSPFDDIVDFLGMMFAITVGTFGEKLEASEI